MAFTASSIATSMNIYCAALRFAVTFMFWVSGIAKLFDFSGAVAEMRRFGLTPAGPIAVGVIAVTIGASSLILMGLHVWICALALALFTLSTIPVAHDFWNAQGDLAVMKKHFAAEHITVVAGLVLLALLDLGGQ